MKIFSVSFLAVIIIPLLFAYFQNRAYEKKLKPALLSEVNEVITAKGVEDAKFTVDKLDVSISGVVAEKATINELKSAIDALGGGAVRVKASDYNVQLYGDADVQKIGKEVFLAGNVGDPESNLAKLNSVSMVGLIGVTGGSSLNHDQVYRDASALKTKELAGWSARYLSLKGDRGYKISALDNTAKPYGKVTPRLREMLSSSAKKMGLAMDASGFEMVDPDPTTLAISNVGGISSLNGNAPKGFNSEQFYKADKFSVKTDDFIDLAPSLASPAFRAWVASYFNAKGERGMSIVHDQVTLSGPGTSMLQDKWLGELRNLGVKPTSKLEIYPSEYHYPDYKLESQIDRATQRALLDAFSFNEIFFDSGSSEVREDQQGKIDALAAAITNAGDVVSLVIGGHADATGNAELNRNLSKKRATSVVTALAEKGISAQRFTIVSFGAAKAAGGGSNESDRKVELRIK